MKRKRRINKLFKKIKKIIKDELKFIEEVPAAEEFDVWISADFIEENLVKYEVDIELFEEVVESLQKWFKQEGILHLEVYCDGDYIAIKDKSRIEESKINH